MTKILLVDDDTQFCEAIQQMLELLDHEVDVVHTLADALAYLETSRVDQVLLDFMLPDGSGLHLVDRLTTLPNAPFVTLITGHPSVRNIVGALTGPGVNYLLKPLRRENLEAAINNITRFDRGERFSGTRHFGCVIGESEKMRELYTMIERVSRTGANVMLLGESGVGKEVIAQAIHNASNTGKPLVVTNCGAFSRELIGSELFGHEKGAFTGAIARRAGVFEQAKGGCLFLDEITEMPLDIQPTLLRVLETGRLTRVGGVKEIDVDCRVISATNRSHEELAEGNVLREDLYFRLAVFPIHIPPLRERIEDIPLLASAFLEEFNTKHGTAYQWSASQLDTLMHYEWPGNVRELRHTVHRTSILSDPLSTELTLPRDIASPFAKTRKPVGALSPGHTIDEVERELIRVTLEQLDGDKPKAAAMLGISLKTLYNRLNQYEKEGGLV